MRHGQVTAILKNLKSLDHGMILQNTLIMMKKTLTIFGTIPKNVNVYSLEAINENLSFTDDYSIESLERNIDLIQNLSSKVIINGFEEDSELKFLDSDENKQKKLMEHQSLVLKDWVDNNFFGIIKHATGSGKTITGINGIREWLKINNTVIVLVPSVLLLEQWIVEPENELGDVNIIKTLEVSLKNWDQLKISNIK